MNIKILTKISICVAVLCISSYFAFPVPFSPMLITAQTVMINLIALIFKPKYACIAVGVYILLGLCGLPVFSGGTGGIGRIIGPTGGFILAFIPMVLVISLLKGKKPNLIRYIVVTIGCGMLIAYLMGSIVMAISTNSTLGAALMMAVVPYIIGDVIKCILASILAVSLNKIPSINSI